MIEIYDSERGVFAAALPPFVAALGDFDGVHTGHRAVLSRAVRLAESLGVACAAWYFKESFKPSPSLTSAAEKRRLISSCGVNFAAAEDFGTVKDMTPEEFVRDYLLPLGCRGAVCGFNFRFGQSASGDAETLSRLCEKYGVSFEIAPPVEYGGEPVSSTRIRDAVGRGDVAAARDMLGRRYSVEGVVEHGRTLGHKLGFPTVNIEFEKGLAVPRYGVYFTYTDVDGMLYPSVSNAGSRPTVGGHAARLETHILNYDGDLYGKSVRVEFIEFRRPETAFPSPDDLAAAIKEDKSAAEKFFKERGDTV